MLKFLVCYSCLTCTISYRKGSQVHGPMTPRASRARSWIGLCHEITFSFHTLCHPFHDILSFDDINYSISYLSIRSTTLRTNLNHSTTHQYLKHHHHPFSLDVSTMHCYKTKPAQPYETYLIYLFHLLFRIAFVTASYSHTQLHSALHSYSPCFVPQPVVSTAFSQGI